MTTFAEKISRLPRLGVGVSGEFNIGAHGIEVNRMKEQHPELIHFYEYGGDLERGLDESVRAWASAGLPTTYHFLDVNLEERIDVDQAWLRRTKTLATEIKAAWLCGDAGRWHFGLRERGHGLLTPPILCRESAIETAESIQAIESGIGLLCLPENPPSIIYLGDLHILDYFALVADRADCGLLLDCAHLAIFQHSRGFHPLTGLENYPLDRVVEMHVAGGSPAEIEGFLYIEDDHSPEPVAATWEILEHVIPKAKNLKAIVFECERNAPEQCVEGFTRLNSLFPATFRQAQTVEAA
jgi:uncharacterized protein (UPF0276 family)